VEIRKEIDNSILRRESEEKSIPFVDLLLKKLKNISQKEKTGHTLFAVCPNSENVMKASLRAAKRANAPIMFAATLNQVDIDRGYTGWNQNDLVRKIKEYSYSIGYSGPIIVSVDHGGPWLKDIQTIEKWNLDKSMNWIKKSFEAALEAGYDLIHIDPTVDIFSNQIKIETITERTIELIAHVEKFCKFKKIGPVSYEVGTEEVHGGLVNIDVFSKFLKFLKDGLEKVGLDYVWPSFIVGKVGTDLHTTTFNLDAAETIVNIAATYDSCIKGHYTDFVDNPKDYPKSGVAGANVGPEFTILEFEALEELHEIECELYKENKISIKSNFIKVLEKAVFDSGRWKKWLLKSENNFDKLNNERKEWIIKTSARYVWAKPEVKCSQNRLYNNLKLNGIDGESIVLNNIEKSMDKYFREFNLLDLNSKLMN